MKEFFNALGSVSSGYSLPTVRLSQYTLNSQGTKGATRNLTNQAQESITNLANQALQGTDVATQQAIGAIQDSTQQSIQAGVPQSSQGLNALTQQAKLLGLAVPEGGFLEYSRALEAQRKFEQERQQAQQLLTQQQAFLKEQEELKKPRAISEIQNDLKKIKASSSFKELSRSTDQYGPAFMRAGFSSDGKDYLKLAKERNLLATPEAQRAAKQAELGMLTLRQWGKKHGGNFSNAPDMYDFASYENGKVSMGREGEALALVSKYNYLLDELDQAKNNPDAPFVPRTELLPTIDDVGIHYAVMGDSLVEKAGDNPYLDNRFRAGSVRMNREYNEEAKKRLANIPDGARLDTDLGEFILDKNFGVIPDTADSKKGKFSDISNLVPESQRAFFEAALRGEDLSTITTPELPQFIDPNQDGANTALEALRNTPGYQFALDQGQKSVERSAAARGGLYSGAVQKELTQFGQGLADQTFQQALQNLQGVINLGAQFDQQKGQADLVAGQNIANVLQAGQAARSNILGNLGNQQIQTAGQMSGLLGNLATASISAGATLGAAQTAANAQKQVAQINALAGLMGKLGN